MKVSSMSRDHQLFVILCGIPGLGKDTICSKLESFQEFQNVEFISQDQFLTKDRSELCRNAVRSALIQGKTVVLKRNSFNVSDRAPYLKIAKELRSNNSCPHLRIIGIVPTELTSSYHLRHSKIILQAACHGALQRLHPIHGEGHETLAETELVPHVVSSFYKSFEVPSFSEVDNVYSVPYLRSTPSTLIGSSPWNYSLTFRETKELSLFTPFKKNSNFPSSGKKSFSRTSPSYHNRQPIRSIPPVQSPRPSPSRLPTPPIPPPHEIPGSVLAQQNNVNVNALTPLSPPSPFPSPPIGESHNLFDPHSSLSPSSTTSPSLPSPPLPLSLSPNSIPQIEEQEKKTKDTEKEERKVELEEEGHCVSPLSSSQLSDLPTPPLPVSLLPISTILTNSPPLQSSSDPFDSVLSLLNSLPVHSPPSPLSSPSSPILPHSLPSSSSSSTNQLLLDSTPPHSTPPPTTPTRPNERPLSTPPRRPLSPFSPLLPFTNDQPLTISSPPHIPFAFSPSHAYLSFCLPPTLPHLLSPSSSSSSTSSSSSSIPCFSPFLSPCPFMSPQEGERDLRRLPLDIALDILDLLRSHLPPPPLLSDSPSLPPPPPDSPHSS